MPFPSACCGGADTTAKEDTDTDADTELSHCLRQSSPSPPLWCPFFIDTHEN